MWLELHPRLPHGAEPIKARMVDLTGIEPADSLTDTPESGSPTEYRTPTSDLKDQ